MEKVFHPGNLIARKFKKVKIQRICRKIQAIFDIRIILSKWPAIFSCSFPKVLNLFLKEIKEI